MALGLEEMSQFNLVQPLLSDTESGLTTTDKQCGAPIDTNEGCDTIDVPIRTEECYCTTDLCNGGTGSNLAFGTLIMSFIVTLSQIVL